MNKSKRFFISMFLLCLCYFCGFQVRAMNIGKNLYRVCKNDVFIDYDQQNTKKIVTEVKQDGSFVAEDLGSWIEKQNFYNISVVEEEESYKKMYYESNFEVQEETNRASEMESFSVNETGLLTVKAISRPRSGLRISALFHLNM